MSRRAAERKIESLAVAQDASGLYWVVAPQGGVIVERHALAGEQIGWGRPDPLFVIAELDEVVVIADVPESDAARLQVGQHAAVLPPGQSTTPLVGRIEHVAPIVDPVRHMVSVRVRVSNDTQVLRPHAFVEVVFAPDDERRVVIPADAVLTDDRESFVFVGEVGHPLRRRDVRVGRRAGGLVEIVSGLAAGESYVAKGAGLLLNSVDLVNE